LCRSVVLFVFSFCSPSVSVLPMLKYIFGCHDKTAPEVLEREAIAMDPEIPWLKRFEELHEPNDNMEEVDYETMLEELEFR